MKENNLEALMPTHFLLIIIYKIKLKNATLKIFKRGHSLSDFFFLGHKNSHKACIFSGRVNFKYSALLKPYIIWMTWEFSWYSIHITFHRPSFLPRNNIPKICIRFRVVIFNGENINLYQYSVYKLLLF